MKRFLLFSIGFLLSITSLFAQHDYTSEEVINILTELHTDHSITSNCRLDVDWSNIYVTINGNIYSKTKSDPTFKASDYYNGTANEYYNVIIEAKETAVTECNLGEPNETYDKIETNRSKVLTIKNLNYNGTSGTTISVYPNQKLSFYDVFEISAQDQDYWENYWRVGMSYEVDGKGQNTHDFSRSGDLNFGVEGTDGGDNPAQYKTYKFTFTLDCQCSQDGRFFAVDVLVKPYPVKLNFPISELCQGANSPILVGGSPTGGIYKINGQVSTTVPTDKAGQIAIEYTYMGNSATDVVTINPKPSAPSLSFPSFYPDDPVFQISGGLPSNGDYLENNSIVTSFDPSRGKGSYPITYKITDSKGCSNSTTKSIVVNPLRTGEDYGNVAFCKDDGVVSLGGSLDGGEIFIDGNKIIGTSFNTGDYSVGNHPAVFKKPHFTDNNFTITIKANPALTVNSIDDICQNGGDVDLSDYVNIKGGTFSNITLSGTIFETDKHVPGDYSFNYTVTSNGCSTTKGESFKVKSVDQASIAPYAQYYVDDAPITLKGGLPSGSGGKYLLNGKVATTANPATLGAGTHTTGYQYTNGGNCTTTATTPLVIKPLEAAYVVSDVEFCQNIGTVSVVTDNFGGTVFVNDVNIGGNSINTNDYAPGTYQGKIVKKHYQTSYFKVIIRPVPSASLAVVPNYCQNIGEITFSGGLPADGEFWLDNIKKSSENSANLTLGEHELRYVVTNQYGCSNEDSKKFDILKVDQASIAAYDEYYVDDAPITLKGGLPSGSGGKYLLNGNVATTANPATLGAGTHTTGYQYTNSGNCSTTATTPLVIKPLEAAYTVPDVEFCQNIGTVSVVTDNFGGTVYVNDVALSGNNINTEDYLPGTYQGKLVKKHYQTSYFDVVIRPVPEPTLAVVPNYCQNIGEITFSGGLPADGEFWLDNIKKSSENSANLTLGEHELRYVVTNQYGCSNEDSKKFDILKVDQASIAAYDEYYVDDAPITLKGGLPSGSGGKYLLNGNVATTANPATLGAGTHTTGYQYTNSGNCSTTATTPLVIKPLEAAYTVPDVEFCQNIGTVSVVTDNFGGTVFVNDVNIGGNSINTNDYAPGEYQGKIIKKHYQTSYFKVIIRPVTSASLSDVSDYCQNYGEIVFSGGLPADGEYWLDNIKKSSENSESMTLGGHELRYVVTNQYGCVDEDSKNFDILKVDQASIAAYDEYYVDDAPITLKGGLPSGSGGKYLLNGNVATTANPATLGAGTHTTGYQYTNSGNCSTTATTPLVIKPLEAAYTVPDVEFCQNIGTVSVVTDNFGGTVFVNDVNIGGNSINTNDYAPGEYQGKIVKKHYQTSYFKVIIRPVPNPTLADFAAKCQNADEFILEGGLPKQGGIYLVNNIEKVTVLPGDYAIKEHEVTYQVTNEFGCVNSVKKPLEILAPPSVILNEFPIKYVDDEEFDLDGGFPQGGSFIINNQHVTSVYPKAKGAGEYEVSYRFDANNGCYDIAKTTLTIKDLEPAMIIENVEVCQNAGLTKIIDDLYGGQLFVEGVLIDGRLINSNDYAPGEYNVVLERKHYHDSKFKLIIRPVPEPTIAKIDDICENGNSFTFTQGSPVNGEYILNGATATEFDTPNATLGEQNVTYKVTNEFGCEASISTTFNVKKVTNATLTAFDNVYVDEPEFTFNNGTPLVEKSSEIATYSINNDVVSKFNAPNRGQGDYPVIYSFTNEFGCTDTDTKTLKVIPLEPAYTIPNVELCNNVGLAVIIKDKFGGTLYVNDELISGNTINTNDYIPGTYQAKLVKNHYETSFFDVIIRPVPTPTLAKVDDICENENSFTFTQGLPVNGEYILNGATATEFDTPNATLGEQNLTYKVTNEFGCEASISTTFNVKKVTNATLTAFDNVYVDEPEFTFNNGTPLVEKSSEIATYSINNDVVSKFNAPNRGQGDYPVIYSFTNEFGCTDTDTKTLKVIPLEPVYTIPNVELCNNVGLAVIIKDKFGGTLYVNDELISGNTINTENYIPGTYQAKLVKNHYETSFFDVIIHPVPEPTMSKIDDVCQNGDEVILGGGSPANGIFLIDNIEQVKIIPENYAVDNHNATYQVTNEFGCVGSVSQTFKVKGFPEIFLPELGDMCENGEIVELDFAKPDNGTYLLNTLPVTEVNPQILDKGEQKLKYLSTNSEGCSNSKEITFNIKEAPEVTFPLLPEFCETDEPYEINLSGEITGEGVINGVFHPQIGEGEYKLTRTIKNAEGCSDYAETIVKVHANPKPELSFIPSVCNNGEAFELRQFANMDGTFTVNGEEMNKFFPENNKPGKYEVVFRAENSNGCYAEARRTFEVLAVSPLDHPEIDPVCENGKNILLPGGSLTGTYDPEPFIIGGYIRPDLAEIGFNDFTFRHTNSNGCVSTITKQVEVYQKPDVTFNPISKICENAEPVICSGGLPVGGDYYLDNEKIVMLNPGIGAGLYTYEYRYKDPETDCEVSIKKPLEILPVSMINIGKIDDVCQNGNVVALAGLGYPQNGDWFLNNNPVNEIDPSGQKPGTKILKYQVTNNHGCTSFETKSFKVLETPEVVFKTQKSVCETDEPFTVIGGFPEGGEVTGTGVIDGMFYPQIGPGEYTLRYTVTIGECSEYAETTIIVLPSPTVTMSVLGVICNNAAPLKLDQGEPSGGYYSLTTIDGERIVEFDPRGREPGDYKIWYTIENENGCIQSTSRTITIVEAPTPTLAKFEPVCKNADRFKLEGGYPEGGSYIINDEVLVWFDPQYYEPGIYPVIYEYSFENSCTQQVKGFIEVLPVPVDPSVSVKDVYCPGEEIKLEASTQDYTVNWYKEDLSQLKEDSHSVKLQSDEPFAAYIQYCNSVGCKSEMRRIEVNVETISTNIEAEEFEVEQGTPVQLDANAKTSGDVEQYYWQFSDGSESFDKNPWHYFDLLGDNDVKLTVTTKNNCVLSQEVQGIIKVVEKSTEDDTDKQDLVIDPTDQDENTNVEIGSIYPNPTSDKFYLEANKNVKVRVRILAITGTSVYSKDVHLTGKYQVDISALPAGIYILNVIDLENSTSISTQKIIKK